MIVVYTNKELEQARRNKEEKIIVEGNSARSLLFRRMFQNIIGVILIGVSLFALPVKGVLTKSDGVYSGPAPGFRYPLSSGSPPTLMEIVLLAIVFFAGVLIIWKPWSVYETSRLGEQPLKVILLRKK
ncbi:MAG: hypothetical protein FVQ81_01850 [Candidatus Glassbacteria bacterium]|nr:hypothetical protein [Candidatus Glassbacteria bacterium]